MESLSEEDASGSSGRVSARVVVERRTDRDRRDGHEAPIIAEASGNDLSSLLEALVRLAADNVAVARGLQKLLRDRRR